MKKRCLFRALLAAATVVATLTLVPAPARAATPSAPGDGAAPADGAAPGDQAGSGAGNGPAIDPARRDREIRGLVARAEAEGPQRVVVRLRRQSDQVTVLDSLRNARSEFRTLTRFHRYPLLAIEAGAPALQRLAAAPEVLRIQPDVAQPPTLASSLQVINADDVHDFGHVGTGQTVAILDTGIDRDHPFFAGRLVDEACYSSDDDGEQTLCPNGGTSQTGAGAADATTATCVDGTTNLCDHGSHVAGIAAGAAAGVTGAPGDGVAPGAEIIAVQVFTRFDNADDCGDNPAPCVLSYVSDQIEALERIADISGGHDIAAVNMSLGGGEEAAACDDDARKEAIDDLLALGITTVVSAGNDGHGAAVGAPACISTAVTVGATTDGDAVAGFSNRGTLLDLFAPGVGIDSSVPDNTWANFDGTSMAAPHVTGAYAVLAAALPGQTPAQLLTALRDTGVPVTYASGGGNVTTPRIDLLAAADPAIPDPPTADAGGPYQTVEGTPVTLAGSGTNATAYDWDFDGDGAFDDASGTNPTFGLVGRDGVVTVRLRVTGPGGTATDQATVTITNAPPQVTATVAGPRPEGATVTASGTVTDPGWLDPLTATIDWGDGTGGPLTGPVEHDPPNATLSFTANHVYGDNGTFTVTICGSDDDTTSCGEAEVTITNVAPDAAIDKSAAVDTPGGSTIVTHADDEVALSARVTDPGSDDLTVSWDYGDGAPAPDRTTPSLVNPPNPDPPLSPSVQPRDITDNAEVSYDRACVYQVGLAATDDDGGTDTDSVTVVVQDNGLLKKLPTIWYLEFLVTSLPPEHLPDDILECYLDIAGHMSGVFGEVTDASTVDRARNVLALRLLPSAQQRFDRELLTVWLNFAHGPFDLDDPVDTDCDLHADDGTFAEVVRAAEAVRVNPASSAAAIRAQAGVLERVTLCNPL